MITKDLPPPLEMPDRIYAIGDIHGQRDQLRAIHTMIAEDFADQPVRTALIIHLGDYIDRGPDAAGCLDILAGGSPIAGVACCNLTGNHEQMLLDALSQPGTAPLWLANGGKATLLSWGIDPATDPATWRDLIPIRHLDFLTSLLPKYLAGPYLFVHAGVRPGVRLSAQSIFDLLWIREGFLDWEGIMLPDAPGLRIVHGHTPGTEPELRPNRLGIDTNAGRGGKLTCAALSLESVYFLQA